MTATVGQAYYNPSFPVCFIFFRILGGNRDYLLWPLSGPPYRRIDVDRVNGRFVFPVGQRTVEHLIVGMDVLDRYAGKQFAPRFLGFPDDRDFFILTRRDGAP